MAIKQIKISPIDYVYDEWQIAERDCRHADDPESLAYHTGQADAFRDVFIRLSKEENPEFDFAKFCALMLLNDSTFMVDHGELDAD